MRVVKPMVQAGWCTQHCRLEYHPFLLEWQELRDKGLYNRRNSRHYLRERKREGDYSLQSFKPLSQTQPSWSPASSFSTVASTCPLWLTPWRAWSMPKISLWKTPMCLL